MDMLCNKGMGAGLMLRTGKMNGIIKGMKDILSVPISYKLLTGDKPNDPICHKICPKLEHFGVDALIIHGRSKQQRYKQLSNWDYVKKCAESVKIPVIGNGDVLSHIDYYDKLQNYSCSSIMIGRGALIKPWIFKEIKDQQYYDISSSERLEILKTYVKYGLDHFGSDEYGVTKTRRFLLEWLSFLHRYIPVGLLEVLPQKINERAPNYFGRNELETLMGSTDCNDWIKISEMLLGKVPENFKFIPKHKSSSYDDVQY
jgi:tRNA-dihydrouridine synthase 3